ncbi:EXLDI protein [Nocardia sp. NPDC050406]|uniref:EXLDI protein n=1 Tax=Nocardia sp. NPDC050406 TaxID=3364318 RepID=UPI0037B568F0
MSTDLRKSDSVTDGEYTEYELRIGPGGGRRERFVGRKIGADRKFTKKSFAVFTVYQGRTGKFLVHRQESDWAGASQVVANWTRGVKSWRDLVDLGEEGWRELIDLGEDGWGEFTSEVVDSIGELRGRVPERLYRTVIDVVGKPSVQVLDI